MSDNRVCLTMDDDCLHALRLRAIVASGAAIPSVGSIELLAAISRRQPLQSRGKKYWRIRCTEQALGFMRCETPDIARRWPAVFGDVEMPRSLALALIGEGAVGKTIAGFEVDCQGVARLVLEGGMAIVFGTDGSIDLEDRDALARAGHDPAGVDRC